MQPKLSLLTEDLIQRILDEAFQLMLKPGIKVQNAEARELLKSAGALVNEETFVTQIPEQLVRKALKTVPHQFHLYDYDGNPKVQYGGEAVHFDPGSSGVAILDPDTLEHRDARTPDLIRVLKVAEQIAQYDAQSTAIVCTARRAPRPPPGTPSFLIRPRRPGARPPAPRRSSGTPRRCGRSRAGG